MAYKNYRVTGVAHQIDHAPEWWYWEVLLDGRRYANGVARSEQDAVDALDFATAACDRMFNQEGLTPDFDVPWYD